MTITQNECFIDKQTLTVHEQYEEEITKYLEELQERRAKLEKENFIHHN